MNTQSHQKKDDLNELSKLLTEFELGSTDAAGKERVRELLRTNPACRSAYVQHQLLTAALANPNVGRAIADSAAVEQTDTLVPAASNSAFRWRGTLVGLLALATSLLVMVATRWVALEFGGPVGQPQFASGPLQREVLSPLRQVEATDTGVAVLSQSVDASWTSEIAPEIGEAIPTGKLTLAAGVVQLEFFCGATVVVEAPAELNLISSMHARVLSGKLRAQVPPAARGFKLDFHDTTLVDLGTEFAIDVGPESADVQVFDGEVELLPGGDDKRLLVAGEAVHRSKGGNLQTSTLAPNSFVDIATLEARARASSNSRYQKWREETHKLQADQRLIALYTFDGEGDWRRRLPNQAAAQAALKPSELDGAIVGAERVDGRWSDKSALEFKRPGDRVRIAVPGSFQSLTFSCWAKIDSLDRWFNSLFLTDGYNAGEPHWQILNSGRMYFSVLPSEIGQGGPRDFKSVSPPFWKPTMSGKWQHLATTYDVPNAQITHYINGQEISQEAVPVESLVTTTRIGAASIGNWSQPTRKDAEFAIRNLNGSIDELAIFSAALSADEIKEIYEYGKP